MQTALLSIGKRHGHSLKAANVEGPSSSSRLFYVTDRLTKVRYLVDTGAEVSVVPPTPEDRKYRKETPPLQAVNGATIKAYGEKSLTLDIGLRRTFRWIFIIAEVRQAIIGADFLRRFGLTVDLRQYQLIDTETQLSVQVLISKTPPLRPFLPRGEMDSQWKRITDEFPSVFGPHALPQKIQHSITHHIKTTGPPLSSHVHDDCHQTDFR